jgi:hypothetical protein
VGGSVVTARQEQAVLAVVRLIGDQDVEANAQHASSTRAAATVRIGRALLYLNDQATAGTSTRRLQLGHLVPPRVFFATPRSLNLVLAAPPAVD